MEVLCDRDPDFVTELHPAPRCLLLIKTGMCDIGGRRGEGDALRRPEITQQRGSEKNCACYRNQVISLLGLLIIQL